MKRSTASSLRAPAPRATVFEAVERARVEAVGANRMSGMADNLAAKVRERICARPLPAHHSRATTLRWSDALSLLVRERLTGRAAARDGRKRSSISGVPRSRSAPVDVLDRMAGLIENQEGFGRLARDLLKELELSEDLQRRRIRRGEDENAETPDSGRSDGETEDNEGDKGQDQDREDRQSEGDAGETKEQRRDHRSRRFRDPRMTAPTASRRRSPGVRTSPFSMTPTRSAITVFTPRPMTRRSPPTRFRRRTSSSACARSSTRS